MQGGWVLDWMPKDKVEMQAEKEMCRDGILMMMRRRRRQKRKDGAAVVRK